MKYEFCLRNVEFAHDRKFTHAIMWRQILFWYSSAEFLGGGGGSVGFVIAAS